MRDDLVGPWYRKLLYWLLRILPAKVDWVTGRSMQPTFQPGDILLFRRKPFAVGDVILYWEGPDLTGGITTHRIISIRENIIRTQGDNPELSTWHYTTPQYIVGVLVCRLWRAR